MGNVAGVPEGEHLNPEFLSRLQFGLTASFHFIFPPISMGLGLMLVAMGIVYVRTRDPKWRQLSFFWVKIYGIVFAMGVATGIVQEFEFGMNWADYSRFVGNVFGSLLAAEGVFAFFLEGGFLGLMLFGGNRLGPRLWLFSIFMVTFGAHFSAQLLLTTFAASLFWSLATWNYLLLRQAVDQKPFDEIAAGDEDRRHELPVAGIPATDYRPASHDGQPTVAQAEAVVPS